MASVFKNDRLTHINLTEDQIEQLEKIREAAFDAYADGNPGCVLGQISFYKQKLSVTFLTNDEVKKLATAFGVDNLGARTF